MSATRSAANINRKIIGLSGKPANKRANVTTHRTLAKTTATTMAGAFRIIQLACVYPPKRRAKTGGMVFRSAFKCENVGSRNGTSSRLWVWRRAIFVRVFELIIQWEKGETRHKNTHSKHRTYFHMAVRLGKALRD